MNTFNCVIVSTDKCIFKGEVWQVKVPAVSGFFSIRKDHAPIVSVLQRGIIEIAFSEENRKTFSINSGVLEHSENQCIIFVDE
ncbi:MAG: F0F1 ATP synthase subunit epsilon [Chitinispirillaceae bacterium]|nr:F0F1 ATP synthase subunit epsilon [Chitinispirillaceae bacterium]